MTKPWVSCVIIAFHRPAKLEALVAQIQSDEIEIIVVNVDDDEEVRRAAGGAHVIPLFGDPGYAAGVNVGTDAATGDVVVFVSDDARLDADAVLALARVVATGEADVAVPRIIDSTGVTERTIAALPSVGSLIREWLFLPDRPVGWLTRWVKVEKWRLPHHPEFVDAASAVVVAVSRDMLVAHPMPEAYFLYWEESDWFWELREHGIVVQYRPELVCRHDGGRDDVRPDKSRLLARNAVRCVRNTQGRRRAALAWFVVMAWNLRLVVVDATRCAFDPTERTQSRFHARSAGLGAAVRSWTEVR